MIAGSRHIPLQPYLVEPQMEKFIIDYKAMETDGTHPIIIAAFLHDKLVEIHPFIDGNGRISRLLMNLYLLSKGFTITSLKADNEAKQAYYNALETSHTESNAEPFRLLVAKAVCQSMEKYLKIIEW
jgi:Fic family protein